MGHPRYRCACNRRTGCGFTGNCRLALLAWPGWSLLKLAASWMALCLCLTDVGVSSPSPTTSFTNSYSTLLFHQWTCKSSLRRKTHILFCLSETVYGHLSPCHHQSLHKPSDQSKQRYTKKPLTSSKQSQYAPQVQFIPYLTASNESEWNKRDLQPLDRAS